MCKKMYILTGVSDHQLLFLVAFSRKKSNRNNQTRLLKQCSVIWTNTTVNIKYPVVIMDSVQIKWIMWYMGMMMIMRGRLTPKLASFSLSPELLMNVSKWKVECEWNETDWNRWFRLQDIDYIAKSIHSSIQIII